MKQFIELLEEILDKSEKLKDGSYIIPKWLVRKIVKLLKDSRKENKKGNRRNESKNHKDTSIIQKVETTVDWENKQKEREQHDYENFNFSVK
jgi:hypothetical protein